MKKKSLLRVPHTYVILFGLVVLLAALSYVVPASTYDMMTVGDREVVNPDTYHLVQSSPVTLMELLTSLPRGLTEASEIVFFIFILGGAFTVIGATGAIENGVKATAKRLRFFPSLMIPVLLLLFGILGATIGLAEETIVFIPLGVMLARSLGYDAILGVSIIFLGAACGFNAGIMNPFTVGVAQSIAELPPYSGIGLRVAIFFCFILATTAYLIAYGRRVQRDPSKSLVHELEEKEAHTRVNLDEEVHFTGVQKIVLLLFVLSIAVLAYGVFKLGFYITEIAAVFLGLMFLTAIVARMNPSRVAELFIEGAKDVTMGALVVGLARAILVILNDGQILYTMVHGVSVVVGQFHNTISAVLMFLFQLFLNLLIPSGSGQAATTMPILVPLSDIVGITRQTAVLAFQLGDGISNSIIPTGGSLLAALSIAKIPYERWVKFIFPLIVIWSLIGACFMVFAVLTSYGPF